MSFLTSWASTGLAQTREAVAARVAKNLPVDATTTIQLTAPAKPGLYRFYLAHTWTTTTVPDGSYDLQVEASDLAGNTGSMTKRFTIANNV